MKIKFDHEECIKVFWEALHSTKIKLVENIFLKELTVGRIKRETIESKKQCPKTFSYFLLYNYFLKNPQLKDLFRVD